MKLLPFAFAAVAASGLASASVVNIDFATSTSGGYTGLAAAPDSAGGSAIWNLAAYAGSEGSLNLSDLADSTGASTPFDFSLSGLDTNLGSQNPSGEMERQGGYSGLMRDYVRVDGVSSGIVATATGKFSGLVVGATYDLYFYGQGELMAPGGSPSLNRGQNSLFTVNGDSLQTEWDDTATGDGLLVEGIEFVKFTAVAINGGAEGGVINFTFSNVVATGSTPNVTSDLAPNGNTPPTNTGSRYGALNGIQLVSVVPEPSSALLVLLGMTGLLARRRR